MAYLHLPITRLFTVDRHLCAIAIATFHPSFPQGVADLAAIEKSISKHAEASTSAELDLVGVAKATVRRKLKL